MNTKLTFVVVRIGSVQRKELYRASVEEFPTYTAEAGSPYDALGQLVAILAENERALDIKVRMSR